MTYFLRVRFKNTQQINVTTFSTALDRALMVISLTPYAEVLGQWEE